MSIEFTSHISDNEGGAHRLYGIPVEQLMHDASYTDTIFLLFSGRMPSEGERALLNSMLIAAAEHGVEAPSLYVPHVSVASGNDVHVGIAAGILAIGESHGGAGEAAALLLLRPEAPEDLVQEYLAEEKRMPGFGHMVYKEEDPRAAVIYGKAKEAGIDLAPFEKAYTLEHALAQQKGKKLPLNIDGAFAAAILGLGLPPSAAKALFVVARVSGMAAHAMEEKKNQAGYYRLTKNA